LGGYSRFQQRIRAEDNVSPGILDFLQGNKSLERQLLRTVLAVRYKEEKEKLVQKCKKMESTRLFERCKEMDQKIRKGEQEEKNLSQDFLGWTEWSLGCSKNGPKQTPIPNTK
jgi:hypothetical protein